LEDVEKNMLIGAFATAGVDLALEGYFAYLDGTGNPPRGQFPYYEIHPAIPPLDDWIACAGVPLGLYLVGKQMRKGSLVEIAKGGAIYGVGTLVGETAYRVMAMSAPPAPSVSYYQVVR
jgi:hypothetical protein